MSTLEITYIAITAYLGAGIGLAWREGVFTPVSWWRNRRIGAIPLLIIFIILAPSAGLVRLGAKVAKWFFVPVARRMSTNL
jgi:hypothetical protein